jgi:hypothetical protein
MSVGIFSRDAAEGAVAIRQRLNDSVLGVILADGYDDLLKKWRELSELPPPDTPEENEKRTAEINQLLKEIDRRSQLPGRPLLDPAEERETVVRREKLVVFKEIVRAAGFSVPDWWEN